MEYRYEVYVACHRSSPVKEASLQLNSPFERRPWHLNNIVAFKRLTIILKEMRYILIHAYIHIYEVISCLDALFFKKLDSRVPDTAHGFQFYKGSSRNDELYKNFSRI